MDGYAPPVTTTVPSAERDAAADAFVAALKIPITFAHYRIDLDHIFMPPFEAFDNTASFVGTEIHECAHASGAKHRLNRDFGARFANEARSIEEITAELTAGFILADLGIAHYPRADHAAYIASSSTHPICLMSADPEIASVVLEIPSVKSARRYASVWFRVNRPAATNVAREQSPKRAVCGGRSRGMAEAR
ncbi:MAG: zincin-like metallopeptidase domain-containing protein [Rhodoplanes sp.]